MGVRVRDFHLRSTLAGQNKRRRWVLHAAGAWELSPEACRIRVFVTPFGFVTILRTATTVFDPVSGLLPQAWLARTFGAY